VRDLVAGHGCSAGHHTPGKYRAVGV
jgi:hypothetical protein